MKLAANIVRIETDHVVLRALDGREWLLATRDTPGDLMRENQAVYLAHDERGYVTAIEPRTPGSLPAGTGKRIEEIRRWVESL
jgi:hypothetical protein